MEVGARVRPRECRAVLAQVDARLLEVCVRLALVGRLLKVRVRVGVRVRVRVRIRVRVGVRVRGWGKGLGCIA